MSNYVDDVRPLSHDAASAAPLGQTAEQIKAAAFNERGKVHTGLPVRAYLLSHLNLKLHAVELETAAAVKVHTREGFVPAVSVDLADEVEYGVSVALAIRHLELQTELRRNRYAEDSPSARVLLGLADLERIKADLS